MMALFISKGMASVAVCAMGTFCMYITNGQRGIGWAVLGLLVIWASSNQIFTVSQGDE